jgi:hypothetical protein
MEINFKKNIMKKLLIIPLLLICLLSSATTYYVSTTGSNNNSGTLSSPFATINKAWSMVSAGDIIYVRGGTYTYAMMGQTVLSGKKWKLRQSNYYFELSRRIACFKFQCKLIFFASNGYLGS